MKKKKITEIIQREKEWEKGNMWIINVKRKLKIRKTEKDEIQEKQEKKGAQCELVT